MNPQPEPYIGNIVALIFFGMLVYFFFQAKKEGKTINIDDLFTIGYIEDPTPTTTVNVQNKIVKKSKPNFESQQLYIDCIDALHAIGFKKMDAKKRAKQIFSSMTNPPNSVQDFLMIALRNEK